MGNLHLICTIFLHHVGAKHVQLHVFCTTFCTIQGSICNIFCTIQSAICTIFCTTPSAICTVICTICTNFCTSSCEICTIKFRISRFLALEWCKLMCKSGCKLDLEWCSWGANCTWSRAQNGANCTWSGAKTKSGANEVQLHMFLHLHGAKHGTKHGANEVQFAHVFAPTWCKRGTICTCSCTYVV